MSQLNQINQLSSSMWNSMGAEWFGRKGIGLRHLMGVRSDLLGVERKASLLLIDGVAMVLAGAVKEADYRRGTFRTARVQMDAEVQRQAVSVDDYRINIIDRYVEFLQRSQARSLYLTYFTDWDKSPDIQFRGQPDPTVFALALTEAVGEVLLEKENASPVHQAMVVAWADMLEWLDREDKGSASGSKRLIAPILLMADWAFISLQGAERDSAGGFSSVNSAPFFIAHNADQMQMQNFSGDRQTGCFAAHLNDYYFFRGVVESSQISSTAPRVMERYTPPKKSFFAGS